MSKWGRRITGTAILVGGCLSVGAIFAVNAYRPLGATRVEVLEKLGTFTGGVVGSVISLAAVILLYATLSAQRESSLSQDFETKYFELIRLHRANVEEMTLRNRSGRGVFVLLLDEFRSALDLIRGMCTIQAADLTPEQCVQVAYYVLFFGIGPNSNRMLLTSLGEVGVDPETAVRISDTLAGAREHQGLYLFDGHQSRLGHYYRHLYQMVRYVDQQGADVLDESRKREHVRTIRAQLSTHEQALLLLNSLTPMGHNWWDKGLVVNYQLVKNLPLDFLDPSSEVDAENLFVPGYFEWQEVRNIALQPRTFVRREPTES